LLASRRSRTALLALSGTLVLSASAAAQGPPPPKAASGKTVKLVATGLTTPTSFAFAGSTVFAGAGPAEGPGGAAGLLTLAGGKATQVPNTPPVVFGLAWHKGKLYVSSGAAITAYRGWNGTTFAGSKTISKGRKGFPGFNGLAFGPDGRLYAGISLNQKYDHGRDPAPLARTVVSMKPGGKDLRVVARGLRQPFQLAFPKGSAHPYVTVLSQDGTKPVPPDQIVVARPGQDYGFPACTWVSVKACKGFATPLVLLPRHSSPMGIAAKGKTLYVSLFGGRGKRGPEVVTIPVAGGKPKAFLSGFAAPVIGLGLHGRTIYAGDVTGSVYKVGI
jgi:glucose/arabinose dehydrogenase